jgi:hypothetical protein
LVENSNYQKMSDTLRNCVKCNSEIRKNYSSNFTFDQIIKQKICEIEKLSQLRFKTDKNQNNDVINLLQNQNK